MERRFADLHCHPHMRSFNWFRDTKIETDGTNYHPWHIVVSSKKKASEGKRAASYSQSDLIKLMNGNVRLVFAVFYPMERGWFINNDMSFKQVMKILSHRKTYKDMYWAALGALFRRNNKKVSLIQKIVEPLYMLIPNSRIKFFREESYSYFDELIREREFILKKNGIRCESLLFPALFEKLLLKDESNKRFFKATGTYQVAVNGDDARAIIDRGDIAFVMTMEGANIFNTDENIEDILDRIKIVKGWHNTPVFFVTLAHHFNNHLCGHAHSLPDEGSFVINQTEGMSNGITEKGWSVIQMLLSIDSYGRKDNELGRRILIDVKHMNAISRDEYYKSIVIPRIESQMDIIPVVASHCCYSGVETLESLIGNMHNEDNSSEVEIMGQRFNPWNINLSDEDIRIIYASGGIIGLNFDQRVLGVAGKLKKEDDHFKALWANLTAIIGVVINTPAGDLYGKSPDDAWSLMTIGTDFDGFIDPANGFSTSLDFEKFYNKLVFELSNAENRRYLLNGKTAEEIANMVCFENAYKFMQTNFKSFA